MIHSTPASLKYFLLNGNKTLLLSNKLHFTYPLSMKKILVLIFALFCYSSCEKFENCIEIEDYINGSYTDEYPMIKGNIFGFNSSTFTFYIGDDTGIIFVSSVNESSKKEWRDKIKEGGSIVVSGEYAYNDTRSCHEITNATIHSYKDGNSTNPLEEKLMGTWKEPHFSNTILYHFLESGGGYYEEKNSYDGYKLSPFTWTIKGMTLEITWEKGNKRTIEISSIVDGNLVGYISNIEIKLAQISTERTTDFDYKKPPYVNYVRYYDGFYYELTKAVMRCNHANGTNSNSKYLQFFGPDGYLDPIGVVFTYFTPYYEGIDKEWYDGTYIINRKSGFWIYGAFYTMRGVDSGRCDGKLTIKTAGEIKFLDFNLDDGDLIGHFEGKFYY